MKNIIETYSTSSQDDDRLANLIGTAGFTLVAVLASLSLVFWIWNLILVVTHFNDIPLWVQIIGILGIVSMGTLSLVSIICIYVTKKKSKRTRKRRRKKR